MTLQVKNGTLQLKNNKFANLLINSYLCAV